MEKQELINELIKEFDLTKKKLGFKASFEEIDDFFFIEDYVLSQKFVSSRHFSRQLASRMMETYTGWINELYAWINPPPTDIIHSNESRSFSQEERKEIIVMIDKLMYLLRKNKRVAFEGVDKEEGKFIDELVDFSRDDFKPFMLKYHIKLEKLWKQNSDK